MDPPQHHFRGKPPKHRLMSRCGEKENKVKKTLFGHLIPYNPGLRTFSKNPSISTDGANCPIHSCKKLGGSLEPFWRKGQKGKKTTFLDT